MADRVLMGRIGRPHGVRGLVHLVSYTDPPSAIFDYAALRDEAGRAVVLRRAGGVTGQGGGLLAGIDGVTDRDTALRLTNAMLYVERALLAAPAEGEFYHADLLGLAAEDEAGRPLGRVVAVHDHGAGAVLEIAGQGPSVLLAFTRAAVPVVDAAGGRIVVNLPEEIVVPPSAGEAA